MAQATQPIDTPRTDGRAWTLKVAAGATIFLGALVAVNAAGFAVPAADTAGLVVAGRANTGADNSAGANGDATIEVEFAAFAYVNSAVNPVTQAHILKPCYVLDDTTVTAAVGNGVRAGLVLGFDGDKVLVDVRR